MSQEAEQEISAYLADHPEMQVWKDRWDSWLQDPVTQALRQAAHLQRERAKESWEQGPIAALTSAEWAVSNAVALGQNRGFKWFEEMDFMGFLSTLEDASEE